jgi:hypothetical protein
VSKLPTDREEPHVSSTLRWEDVSLPASVTLTDLDALIFSLMTSNWRKTARIIGDTAIACKNRSTPLEAEVIGARLRALADAGRIEIQGDISMWRHSEVRLRSNPHAP